MEILFTTNADGTFTVSGKPTFDYGRFYWLDGMIWRTAGAIESVEVMTKRMAHSGPYRHSAYKIIKHEPVVLNIRPTCSSCGAIAGTDCQRTCEYIFGPALVTEMLPIQFNEHRQFRLTIKTAKAGKNFGRMTSTSHWFGSVRCAELFLTLHGYCNLSDEAYGSGARLLRYLTGDQAQKARKKRAPNVSYLARLREKVNRPSEVI